VLYELWHTFSRLLNRRSCVNQDYVLGMGQLSL